MRKKELDGLRFLLAIVVMLWHSRVYIQQLIHTEIIVYRGEIANVIFFMLSGFFVVYSKNISDKMNVFAFLFHKLKKIYPVYFLSVLYIAILYWGRKFLVANPKLLFRHLLLLQAWPFYNKAASEFNGPAWFLSCLLCCWILTPFLVRCFKTRWFNLLLVLLYFAFLIVCLSKSACNGIWRIWPLMSYCMGMRLGDVCNKSKFNRADKKVISLSAAIFFLIAEIACNLKWNDFILYSIIIVFSMVLLFYICVCEDSFLNKILKLKIMSNGGVLTLNMYLVHAPIMYSLDRIDWIKGKLVLWLLSVFSLTTDDSSFIFFLCSSNKVKKIVIFEF